MTDNPGTTQPVAPAVEAPLLQQEAKPARLLSLDVFRGFTLAMMLIANNPGSWSHMYAPFKHAEWNGCTFTDLIFPSFVFIMGVAMTFSFGRRLDEKHSKAQLLGKVVVRSVVLILLALIPSAVWYYTREPNPDSVKLLRFPGVLQRLGVVYFLASLVLLAGLKARGQAVVAALLLVGYHLLMKYVPVPGYGAGVLEKPGNLASYIDTQVFGAHNYEYLKASGTWHDPEGLLSTLPAVASCLIGCVTGYLVRSKTRDGYDKAATMMVWGLGLVVAGWLWAYQFPLNKNLWSPSFVLFAGGWSLLGLGACYWLTDMKRITWWTKPFIVLGTNAIFTFVSVGIVSVAAGRIKWQQDDGSTITLRNWVFNNLVKSWVEPLLGPNGASLGFGIFYIGLWTLMVYLLLYRKKIFIRV